MKNIRNIFLGDARRLGKNVVALVIIMGISIIPCFYAWFNIAASWDPYSNTKAVKIAVANNDKGYKGSIIPLELNVGDSIVSALHANDKLGWTFMDEEDARKGVDAGKYYAAIIIPENFSKNMMSVFSEDIKNPTVEYYYNAKVNAISPKVTGKGSTTIKNMVNQMFNETLENVVLSLLKSINLTDGDVDAEQVSKNLLKSVTDIADDLDSLRDTVDSFSVMTESIQTLLNSTNQFLKDSQSALKTNAGNMTDTSSSIDSLNSTMNSTLDALEESLAQNAAVYDQVISMIENELSSQSVDAAALADALRAMADVAEGIYNAYDAIDQELEALGQQYPDYKDVIMTLQMSIQSMKYQHQNLADRLRVAAGSLETAPGNISAIMDDIVSDLKAIREKTEAALQTYRQDIKAKLENLTAEIQSAENSLQTLLNDIDKSVSAVENAAGNISSELSKVVNALDGTSDLLAKASSDVNALKDEIQKAIDTKDYDQLLKMLSGDTTKLAAYLSSPVQLDTIKVYPVENYGSAMAPFYTALAIWVGGVVLVAMMKTKPGKKSLAGCKNVKHWQIYIGRYLLFLIIGLLQATLICLGDLYFLQIQCLHPFLFMVAGWVASIVYVNIIYTLTISFGDVGKAIAVILMVMQVAGSGGTFPIETTPEIFQNIFPFLPFGHTMTMMRECIAGMYGTAYLREMGILGIFLLISVLFGLFCRKPLIKVTDFVAEKLESTKVIE